MAVQPLQGCRKGGVTMTDRSLVLKPFENERDYMEARISEGIEKHRKADMTIRVTDAAGTPLPGVKVHAAQQSLDFMAGVNLFMLDEMETPEKNETYKQAFAELFSLATLPFYWCDLEPEQGKPRFEKGSPRVYRRPTPELCLEYCTAHGITPKLHCLNYDQWTPRWVPQDVNEVKRLLEKRMREIGERYADRIHGIEVINETLCPPVDHPERKSSPLFADPQVVEWSFETARKYFPQNELIINEATEDAWLGCKYNRGAYYQQIERAMNKGAQIDAIGLQYHMFYPREEEAKRTRDLYDPRKLYQVLDRYAEFGKPLQITEMTIPAYSASAEDEELQAKILCDLFRIFFSHPAVEVAVYWNLVDGYAAFAPQGDMSAGENYYAAGLMHFDLTPKPAYTRLKELLHKTWHTDEVLVTDQNGTATLRGFKGKYKVSAQGVGKGSAKLTTLAQNTSVALTL